MQLRIIFGWMLIWFVPALSAEPFSFAKVESIAKERAAAMYEAAQALPSVLNGLNYDQYRAIRTANDAVIWSDRDSLFRIELLHAGYLFKKPVRINFVSPDEGEVTWIPFSKSRFNYDDLVIHDDFAEAEIAGYSGFRIRHPLNGGSMDFDEIGSFLGASYFRLLGKEQSYGISARGLAINTVREDVGEEFPDFVEYWLVEPKPGSKVLRIYALLDSPSVAGAFQIDITPGVSTDAEIRVKLFFRESVASVGLAPLTSMYWFGENHKERPFMDWRPEVHDSDGMLIHSQHDEMIWRPFYNHFAIRESRYYARDIEGFGVFQRDRRFESYEDLSNPYWKTPTAWIETLSAFGDGAIRLVELPTNNEAMDNIVAYFEPAVAPAKGDEMEYRYVLSWKLQDEVELSPNRVLATRVGEIGAYPDTRRFMIDFVGPDLEELPADAPIFAELTSGANGYITENQCFKNVKTGGWRVEFKLDTDQENTQPVELRCILKDPETGKHLSETWSYQWSP
ncbi:MAG: glucan biosynthesis protein G [Verrucomicrobiales bacterium]|nr:glucan biosynthesis protein G [Verrucomicrobiales bacterium]